jgi:hypothetical protein
MPEVAATFLSMPVFAVNSKVGVRFSPLLLCIALVRVAVAPLISWGPPPAMLDVALCEPV